MKVDEEGGVKAEEEEATEMELCAPGTSLSKIFDMVMDMHFQLSTFGESGSKCLVTKNLKFYICKNIQKLYPVPNIYVKRNMFTECRKFEGSVI